MPTGYTHPVQTGEITEFGEFVWMCARAFGALIHMRDDNSDAPIRERDFGTSYHDERLVSAREELERISGMTLEQADVAAQADYDRQIKERDDAIAQHREYRERYNTMLQKVQAWQAPEGCEELKEFMEKQILESIDFDCDDRYYLEKEITRQTAEDYIRAKMQRAKDDIAYHTGEKLKEDMRKQDVDSWIQRLHASVPCPDRLKGF